MDSYQIEGGDELHHHFVSHDPPISLVWGRGDHENHKRIDIRVDRKKSFLHIEVSGWSINININNFLQKKFDYRMHVLKWVVGNYVVYIGYVNIK